MKTKTELDEMLAELTRLRRAVERTAEDFGKESREYIEARCIYIEAVEAYEAALE